MVGRTVLVTGGSRRIGAAIVDALVARGDRVIVHHRGSAEEAASLGAHATVEGDLEQLDALPDLWRRACTASGAPIDALVNSASAFEFDAPPAIDPALMMRLYAVNCVAPARLATLLADQADLADGWVVNLLDQKLFNMNPDFFGYTCAKAALGATTTMLSQALGPRIRVNAVAPGLTLPSGGQSETEFARVASLNLLGRPVGAGRVADAVTYLIGSSGVYGQTLFVDCGQRFVPSGRDVMFATEGRADG